MSVDHLKSETTPPVARLLHHVYTAWIVLLIGLLLTAAAWYSTDQFVHEKTQQRFDNRAKEISSAIYARMIGYEQMLWGGVGFFRASGIVDRKKFRSYVSSLNIDSNWPGIQGIGFSIPVSAEEKADHIRDIRNEGFPQYTIKPEGDRDAYSAIIYLEPFDWRNERAFGYDMWSNGMRREAMARARDTGKASTSGIITLVQETEDDVQKGFLTYLPLYQDGVPTETVEQRRRAFIGWVYSPFRMGNLMVGILGSGQDEIDYKIFDGVSMSKETMLFNSRKNSDTENPSGVVEFVKTTVMELQGREWTLHFTAGNRLQDASESHQPLIVAFAGLIASLLLFYIVSSLASLQKRAEAIAQNMTKEFRAAKEKADLLNVTLSEKVKELDFQKFALDEHSIVSITDIKGNITYVNDKLCTVSGYSREELMGQNHRMLKSDEHAPEFYKHLWQTISSGKPWNGEIKNLKKDGGFYWVNATIVPTINDQGKPSQYVAIRTDITAEKQASKKAEAANVAKSNFLSTMSHEIRTPLNGVMGLAQLLTDTDLNEDQRKKVETILSSGQTLLGIINDVLDMSKIEAGAIELESDTFSLGDLISTITKPFQSLADDKGLRLIVEDGGLGKRVVKGDSIRLRQILWNLLSNAIKFTEKGSVTLTIAEIDRARDLPTETKACGFHFAVGDTGTGIAPDRIGDIFNAFTQEDNTITRKHGGTGLGLSIVKKLTELMGGTVDAVSQVGAGTVFNVYLPFDAASKEEADAVSQRRVYDSNQKTESLNVLIAEDNEVNALITRAFLEKFGHNVKHVENGKLVVEAAKEGWADLILMDVHMPEMNGIDATKAIRLTKLGKNLPIIGLTAEAFAERHVFFKEAGMNGIITKPFTEQQLADALATFRLVERRSTRRPQRANGTADTNRDVAPIRAADPNESDASKNSPPLAGKPSVVDEEKFNDLRKQLDAATISVLLKEAQRSLRKQMEDLRQGVLDGDTKQIYEVSHAIKGASGSLFAMHVSELAAEIQTRSTDVDAVLGLMSDFESAAKEALEWWHRQET